MKALSESGDCLKKLNKEVSSPLTQRLKQCNSDKACAAWRRL